MVAIEHDNNPTVAITYPYTDAGGRTLYEVLRRPGKKFVQRRPNRDQPGEWHWNLDGIARVPYRLPNLEHTCDQAGIVFVVEGEKDADRLTELGATATTSAGGTSWPWPPDWAQHFHGCTRVYVLADNDHVGRQAANQRATIIATTVPDVRRIDLPGLAEKQDVSDWLDQGNTLDQLYQLCEYAQPLELQPAATPSQPKTLDVRWLTEQWATPPSEPEILVHGLLRRGEMCVIGAPRAIGKSFFGFNLAVLLGQGHGKLAGTLNIARQARVLYAQGELDEYEARLRWYRMTKGQAPANIAETFDRWRIKVVRRRSQTSGRDDGTGWSESDEYIDAILDPRIEETIVNDNIDVLIIDPWAVYYSGAENSNDEVEEALAQLRQLSLNHGLAVVVFHHIGKSRDAREPEDMWRGASRLADWASTRITILPHYSEREAAEMNMTRQDARRFVNAFVLRRSSPTPDFSMRMNHKTGWWEPWTPPGRPIVTSWTPADVAATCLEAGGWSSILKAAVALDVDRNKATELLERAVDEGLIEETKGTNGGRGFRAKETTHEPEF